MLVEYDNLPELIPERTKFSKTFDLGKNKYKLVVSREPIHYDKGNGLEDINLKPIKTDFGYEVNGPGWRLTFYEKNAKFSLTHSNSVFEAESLDNPDISKITLKNKGIEIEEAWPGVDLYLCIRPRGVEWYKRIKSHTAKSSFRWKTSKPQNFIFRETPYGSDSDNNRTLLTREKQENSDHDIVIESFEKKVVIIDRETRVPSSSLNVKYPVFIDVPDVSVSVGSGPDDAYEFEAFGNLFTDLVVIQAGNLANFDDINLGIRFANIPIPQGATIDAAVLKAQQKHNSGVAPSALWYAIDVDNLSASPWAGGINAVTPRTTAKSAFVTTTATAFKQVTHAVTGQIQEIISRTGWSSSNALGLVAMNTGGTAGASDIAAYEHASASPALLEIDYTASGSSGNPWYYYAQH